MNEILAHTLNQAWKGDWRLLDDLVKRDGSKYQHHSDKELRLACLEEQDMLAQGVFLVRTWKELVKQERYYGSEQVFKKVYNSYKLEELVSLPMNKAYSEVNSGYKAYSEIFLYETIKEAVYSAVRKCVEDRGGEISDVRTVFLGFYSVAKAALNRVADDRDRSKLSLKNMTCLYWIGDKKSGNAFVEHLNKESFLFKNALNKVRAIVNRTGGNGNSIVAIIAGYNKKEKRDIKMLFSGLFLGTPHKEVCIIFNKSEDDFIDRVAYKLAGVILEVFNEKTDENEILREQQTISLSQKLTYHGQDISFDDGGELIDTLKAPEPSYELVTGMVKIRRAAQAGHADKMWLLAFMLSFVFGVGQQFISLLLGANRNTVADWVRNVKKIIQTNLIDCDRADVSLALPLSDSDLEIIEYSIRLAFIRLKENFALLGMIEDDLKGIEIEPFAYQFIDPNNNDEDIMQSINLILNEKKIKPLFSLENIRFIKRLHALRPEVKELILYTVYFEMSLKAIIGVYIAGLNIKEFYDLWNEGVAALLSDEWVTNVPDALKQETYRL